MMSQAKRVLVIVEHPSIEMLYDVWSRKLFQDQPTDSAMNTKIYAQMSKQFMKVIERSESPYWRTNDHTDEFVFSVLAFARDRVDMFKICDVAVLYKNLISIEV